MAEEKKVSNIYQKMLAITNEIGIVAKNLEIGTGKASYKAVAEGDVLGSVKPLEKKYGIYSYPCHRTVVTNDVLDVLGSDGNIRKQFYCVVETTYRFVDIEKPENYIEITSYGTGIDSGDKGYGKACTYADKYALMKAYKIVTGEDPDQEASEELSSTKTAPVGSKTSPVAPKTTISATPKQISYIKSLHYALSEEEEKSLTKEQAASIIEECLKRQAEGPAEFKKFIENKNNAKS